MRSLFFGLFIAFACSHLHSQVHDNGIGGYGYVEYNIMHHPKLQGNWIYGGGGLIVNKVYFAGLYYGSQTNAFNNAYLDENNILRPYIDIAGANDSVGSLFNLTLSDVGGQIGGVVFAEKSLQVILSAKAGAFLSNMTEIFSTNQKTTRNSTKAFLTVTPELKVAFMPIKIMKMQVGVGYKAVYYDDSRLQESGTIGSRNWMFNSWYSSFSLVFGSF